MKATLEFNLPEDQDDGDVEQQGVRRRPRELGDRAHARQVQHRQARLQQGPVGAESTWL